MVQSHGVLSVFQGDKGDRGERVSEGPGTQGMAWRLSHGHLLTHCSSLGSPGTRHWCQWTR